MSEVFQTNRGPSSDGRFSCRLVPRGSPESRARTILRSMYEGFLLNPNGPQGSKIRLKLGVPYYWIPDPRGPFFCRWHRLEQEGLAKATVPPGEDLHTLDTGTSESCIPVPSGSANDKSPACEGYFSRWPEGVDVDLVMAGFPLETLPDGRQVFFIPDVPQMGPFTPRTYRRLVESAKDARANVIRHSYDVARGALRLWRSVGPSMGHARERLEKVEVHSKEFWDIWHEVDPSGRNRKFEQWVFYWARELYEKPADKFMPSVKAFEILQRATGYEPSSIESIMRRDTKRRVRPARK